MTIFDQKKKLEFEIIKKVKLLQRNVRLWLERRRLGVIGNNDEKRHKGIVLQILHNSLTVTYYGNAC